jgi:hypothetical protein
MEIQMSDQATTTEQPAGQSVQLQLQDLLLATQVIQLASQRGAIKAEEMETVGGLYTRLVTFLQASGALQPAVPATDATEAPAAE